MLFYLKIKNAPKLWKTPQIGAFIFDMLILLTSSFCKYSHKEFAYIPWIFVHHPCFLRIIRFFTHFVLCLSNYTNRKATALLTAIQKCYG